MVHNTLFILSAILVASLYSVSAAPNGHDPSTVINVYPSLKKLKPKGSSGRTNLGGGGGGGAGGGGGGGGGGSFADNSFKNCEEEAGCGAAASNLEPVLTKKQDEIVDESAESEVKQEDHLKTFKEHKRAKLAKLKAIKGNEQSSNPSEEFQMSSEDLSNFDKMVDKSKASTKGFEAGSKKWTSFQELLQLLKKRKA